MRKVTHLRATYAITDAGYLSEENVNTFYEEQIPFLARLQPNRRLFKSIVKEHLADTKENGVLVKQNNRLVRIKKVSCQLNEKIGKNGKVIEPGHSAYAYLCICWRTGWLLHKCARKNWTLAASNAHDFGA